MDGNEICGDTEAGRARSKPPEPLCDAKLKPCMVETDEDDHAFDRCAGALASITLEVAPSGGGNRLISEQLGCEEVPRRGDRPIRGRELPGMQQIVVTRKDDLASVPTEARELHRLKEARRIWHVPGSLRRCESVEATKLNTPTQIGGGLQCHQADTARPRSLENWRVATEAPSPALRPLGPNEHLLEGNIAGIEAIQHGLERLLYHLKTQSGAAPAFPCSKSLDEVRLHLVVRSAVVVLPQDSHVHLIQQVHWEITVRAQHFFGMPRAIDILQ
mmetsp:Transcript_15301/g.41919  ORF Transcript_15301/g.41919 Transcript_15301/m.41919 type:complete len:274 (-) Transcript_15301:434-1255(-)